MSRTPTRTVCKEGEEVDVVEIKKAWATGNTKATAPVTSASEFSYNLKCIVFYVSSSNFV